jgi:hypothetical protein
MVIWQMTKWQTKSGRFDKAEIQRVDTYLQKAGVSRNKLIRISVLDIVTANKDVDNCLHTRDGNVTGVLSAKFTKDEISTITPYIEAHGMRMNDVIRSSVFYYVANEIPIKKEVDTYLRELPSAEEVVNTLTEIAGKSQSKTWREMFPDTKNIEKLASLFVTSTTAEKTKLYVPSLKSFEKEVAKNYDELYSDTIFAAEIPELRRRTKVNMEIDSDVFDEMLLKLFDAGKYKIEEGSGEDGLRYKGRNFMFLKRVK